MGYEAIGITEPIGWNDDEKEYARHEEYHGIFAKFSNTLKFVGSGADYIDLARQIYGINEEIELLRHEKHPISDKWVLTYSGYLDLSTWSKEKNQTSVKFNSGGLERILKSRESERIEIDRTTTIDGKTITPINTVDVELEGRRIFLKTSYTLKAPNDYGTVFVESNAGNTRNQSVGVPFQLENKSHDQAQSVSVESNGNEDQGATGMMFFAVSDRVRILNISLSFTFNFSFDQEDIDWAYFNINLTRFAGGITYFPAQRITLFSLPTKDDIFNNQGNNFTVNYTGQIQINVGDSLAIEAFEKSDLGGPGHAELRIRMQSMVGWLKIDEDSFYEKTNTKAVLAHELGEQLVKIATGYDNSFYSEFLGRTDIGYPVDGPAGLTAFAHGFWIRGFDKLPIPTDGPPKIENLFKPLTTSFKDYAASFNAVWNTGIGIEKLGMRERVRLEELSFFYNRNTTIKLPFQIKNVKRKTVASKYYSSLQFGYKEGGQYDEACGLDEYNAKSTFTTVINAVKNVFTKISEYRADPYGREFTRRKQKSLNDTEDTSRDNSIWFIDLKRSFGNLFKERLWQDDLEQEPTGVFSPETATMLRYSPINMLQRHAWWFSCGLLPYLTDYIRYGSSTANSRLKTKFIGKNEYAENGDIINSELENPRFIPEEIEFEHICDFSVMEQVNGSTVINGKLIQNIYGQVEFINENNEIEKGFMMNLKPNGKGSWTVLKANR